MGIGVWQVVIILVIVLIVFGAGKLPRVMGDVAKGVKNFKAGMKEEGTTGESEEGNDKKAIPEETTASRSAAPQEENKKEPTQG